MFDYEYDNDADRQQIVDPRRPKRLNTGRARRGLDFTLQGFIPRTQLGLRDKRLKPKLRPGALPVGFRPSGLYPLEERRPLRRLRCESRRVSGRGGAEGHFDKVLDKVLGVSKENFR